MSIIHTVEGKENLLEFVKFHKLELDKLLHDHGAILLRGFKIHSMSEFQKVSESICNKLFDYKYGSTPRTKLGGQIYTSTEYPSDRTIPMHNENSYTNKWPQKILFYCSLEATSGGETPIANSHEVFNLIDETTKEKFLKKGVMYTRNYSMGMDLSWQQTFQTDSKDEVEQFCKENHINYKWLSDSHLMTEQVCQASLKHPIHGYDVWFNQAHLFHQSANDQELQEYFKNIDPKALPRNAFFGDGTPIAETDLDKIRSAYAKAEHSFLWQKGDLMILDNLLYCHGRKPFTGERKVVVAMGE